MFDLTNAILNRRYCDLQLSASYNRERYRLLLLMLQLLTLCK